MNRRSASSYMHMSAPIDIRSEAIGNFTKLLISAFVAVNRTISRTNQSDPYEFVDLHPPKNVQAAKATSCYRYNNWKLFVFIL